MPQKPTELLKKGLQANNNDRFRKENLIVLPGRGSLIIAGDLHGHRRNFERIISYADLANHPERHLILQEIIHGGPEDDKGGCLSFKLLFDAIRYKVEFPDRVHLLMGNHDTAFITNSSVMKNGKEMNRAMRDAIEREYPENSEQIKLAISQFLFSQPLAVKCENGLWASHSLPTKRYVEKFDFDIFHRQLKINDVVKPGSAYLLTWGRRHSRELLEQIAQRLGVETFVLGHQHQESGWCKAGNNMIIIASDHNHGCLMPVELDQPCDVERLLESIIPLASIS